MDVEGGNVELEGDDDDGGPSTSQLVSDTSLHYPDIKFITTVATRMFQALPQEEQEAWRRDTQEEGRAAKEEYKARLANPLESQDSSTRAA